MKYKETTLVKSVCAENDNPCFGESSTQICIEDESAGGYITLTQEPDDSDKQTLKFDIEELKMITEIAEKMLAEYDKNTKSDL